eukprot:CAMPEP_0204641472 /NCGR_PEP_ID=MMETSP0717-20131115/51153_1 /ASSEMBLY_ACC=CAM_ASM_000666 /TAXON_ID=230516 /ORGANISM="Chaetoceros curvisetus" /LENGTH=367 /DNA_ID=CAMNT_0051662137 /DNA_START=124 /DNA_END=1230 /DNA_ORIENTATION=+
MKRRDMYFAIDCEMVGIGPGGIDSALARVSIVNFEKDIVLDTYVKVDEPVTDYRTFVSGIKPEHIESKSAMPLAKVQYLVSKILHGKILVGHGLENDLKVIGIQHPWCDTRDTAKYGPFMRTIEKENTETIRCPKRLRDLVFEKFGKEIQVAGKSHCPVEDAVAAMDLYKAVRNEWEIHMREEVNKAASQRSLSPLQDTREPVEPLHQTHIEPRTLYSYPHQHSPLPSGVAGSQLLFQSPHQHQHQPQHGHHVPQFVTPNEATRQSFHSYHRYMSMSSSPPNIRVYPTSSYTYHMNTTHQYNPTNRTISVVTDARRAKELAKAKVVATLHQQRVMWQQKKQQEMDQQRAVYVEPNLLSLPAPFIPSI